MPVRDVIYGLQEGKTFTFLRQAVTGRTTPGHGDTPTTGTPTLPLAAMRSTPNQPLTPPLRRIGRQQSVRLGEGRGQEPRPDGPASSGRRGVRRDKPAWRRR